jgi:hypothetical protein
MDKMSMDIEIDEEQKPTNNSIATKACVSFTM